MHISKHKPTVPVFHVLDQKNRLGRGDGDTHHRSADLFMANGMDRRLCTDHYNAKCKNMDFFDFFRSCYRRFMAVLF